MLHGQLSSILQGEMFHWTQMSKASNNQSARAQEVIVIVIFIITILNEICGRRIRKESKSRSRSGFG